MSHCLAVVVLPDGTTEDTADTAVGAIIDRWDKMEGDDHRDGFHDGWSIGGRYADWYSVAGPDGDRTSDFLPVGDVLRNIEAALPADRTPFTIVTPDGVWHMEWVDRDANRMAEDPQWYTTVTSKLAPYRDRVAAVVDYHT